MPNNFTHNANGDSIETRVFYDSCLARMDFEDNIEILQHSGYRESCIAFYHGQGTSADDIQWRVVGKRAELVRYVRDFSTLDNAEIRAMRMQELRDFVLDDSTCGILEYLAWYESGQLSLANIFCHIGTYDLQIVPTHNGKDITLQSVETRGYCQGDYAKVYYSPELLESAWGTMPSESIDHLFWDSPVYARVDINGEDYYYYDWPESDYYTWNREGFAAWLASESGASESEILALLPENPDCE